MKTRRQWLRSRLAGIAFLSTAGLAEGACPPDTCECLGEAKNFNLIASQTMQVLEGRQIYYGYSYLIESFVEGDICANKLLGSGPVGHPTYLADALALRDSPGATAATFRKRDPYRDGGYGVYANLVATAGGKVQGLPNLSYNEIDTSGTHPKVASCQQAVADMQSASTTLAALTPTRDLGSIVVKGDYLDLDADPGVNVWRIARLSVQPRRYYGYAQGAAIFINFDSDTEAVIINAYGLSVGEVSQIYSSDPTRTIINLAGPGPAVRVGKFGLVEPPILAPLRTVGVGLQLGDFAVSSIMAARIRLRGSSAFDALNYVCP